MRSSSISSAARAVGGFSFSSSETGTLSVPAMDCSSDNRGSRRPFSIRESWLPAMPTWAPSWSSVSPAPVRKWRMRWPSVARSVMGLIIAKESTFFHLQFPPGTQILGARWYETQFLKRTDQTNDTHPHSVRERHSTGHRHSPGLRTAPGGYPSERDGVGRHDRGPHQARPGVLVRRLPAGVGPDNPRDGGERNPHAPQP